MNISGQLKLYGTTYFGGDEVYNGTIYHIDTAPNTHVLDYSFGSKYPGGYPFYTELIEGPNGHFYGMTELGGLNDMGIIFEWDPITNIYTKKFDFGGLDGVYPFGSLTLSGSLFYGMTERGGSFDQGVIFEWDPATNVFTKKFDFDGNLYGGYPEGDLRFYNNKFYGTTRFGGSSNDGIIFEWDPSSNVFVNKYDFTGTDGADMSGSLTELSGKFYGVTRYGGSNGLGVIFEWDPSSNIYTKKFDCDISTGYNSSFSLTAFNNKFYGVMPNGGLSNRGVLFEWDPISNNYTILVDFNNTSEFEPSGTLTLYNNKLYGVTNSKGTNYDGVIFEWDPINNLYTFLQDFTYLEGGFHFYGKMAVKNGIFYGMKTSGGWADRGTLFSWDPTSNIILKKLDFQGNHGLSPYGSLSLYCNNFFGMAINGGIYNYGVIYEWDPITKLSQIKHDFNKDDGANPVGNLKYFNGKYYGLTYSGGQYNMGTLFEWDPETNAFIKKFEFDNVNGSYPSPNLTLYNDKFYGYTETGGLSNMGIIFEWDPKTNQFVKKFNFAEKNLYYPTGAFVIVGDQLYGSASYQGVNGYGAIFKWDPETNFFSTELDFDYNNGAYPVGFLTFKNNKIYGSTLSGASSPYGILFEWDPFSKLFTQVYNLNAPLTGNNYLGEQVFIGDKMYGTSVVGGTNDRGIIYSWKPSNNDFVDLFDFDITNGAHPVYAKLIAYDSIFLNPTVPTITATDTVICPGFVSRLKIDTGSLNNALEWNWYFGGCGGTLVGTGDSIYVSPTVTTTYFVRGEGGCISGNPCGSITIYMDSINNCNPCPQISSLLLSDTTKCENENSLFIAAGLKNMGATYGIKFIYSDVPLVDPYSGGTEIGTVPNNKLNKTKTKAILDTSISIVGNYFIYAIIDPPHTDPGCRPFADTTFEVSTCNPLITHVCSCLNNATNAANGQFNTEISLTAPSGQTWSVASSSSFYDVSSPYPPDDAYPVSPGTLFSENNLGNGNSIYSLIGRTIDAVGYSIGITNGHFSTSVEDTCYYPNVQPTFILDPYYCSTDPPVLLTGQAELGDGSALATGISYVLVNGNYNIDFNPALYTNGLQTIKYVFDADDNVPNAHHPGCIQDTTLYTFIDTIKPIATCPNPITVDCADLIPLPDPSLVSTTDDCSGQVFVNFVGDDFINQTCSNKFDVIRTYVATDPAQNSSTCTQTISVNDLIPPIAIAKDISVYLDANGLTIISGVDINNGSVDNCISSTLTFAASETIIDCSYLSPKPVTLFVTDDCGNVSSTSALVTALDTTAPILSCVDRQFTVGSGECGIKFNFIPEVQDNCPSSVIVKPLDTSLYKFGQLLLIGFHQIGFIATDPNGNSSTCYMNVTVNPVPNPSMVLVCNSEIQISLNENCIATIGAGEILTGGPYRCFNDYKVEIRDWYTNELIDRDPNLKGSQVGKDDIGKAFRVTVRDTDFKNSCWTKVTIEDKIAPKLICPADTSVRCGRSLTTPDCLGIPIVIENCGTYTLSYFDDVLYGNCAVGYQEQIKRTWTAIDAVGNKSSCTHIIRVLFADLTDVEVPLNYNDFDKPSLLCDEKINKAQDYSSHFLAYPYCVDGYLLDSAHWFATGGYLPSPAGDLAGERLPRVLGWNCIDTGEYAGHPSPYPVFYPAHPGWDKIYPVCWGPDQVVMWLGTGIPEGGNCLNLSLNFQDLKIDLGKPNCDAGSIGCFKILRQWTVLDWCTGQIGGHSQIIMVKDKKGPSIIFTDSVLVNMEEFSCNGKFEVPKPWLTDNCSNDIHYYVTAESGFVIGDEIAGYIITNIKPGIWNNYIVAEDCCGNVSKYRFVINAIDNVPPTPVCEKTTVVSLNTNQVDGQSFGQIFAKDFDEGSWDNCSGHLIFKVIRMDQLRGTNHGSGNNQADNGTNCAGVNGDDYISNGNQIFFDDYVRFCCGDVGKTVRVVLRVFDKETGDGPIHPARMNNNGDLAGHFNDCMVDVQVQDKTIPIIQAPPDIIVSCSFWFDIDKIDKSDDPTFGRVVTEYSSRKKVITKDVVCHNYCVSNVISGYPGYIPGASSSNPPASNKACNFYKYYFDTSHFDRTYDLLWGFDGTVIGACGTNFSIAVNDNRECGQGRISRTIIALGPNGFTVTATQTIWVVDCDPFYINGNDDCDPDDDIRWPGNCTGVATTIEGCGADISPDNPLLGRPEIQNNADDLCSLISTEFVDEIFTIEPDACFKVLRKWTVIDWCQYDPTLNPNVGRWEYLQIIKVHDIDKPVISITFGNCYAAVKNPKDNVCYGYLQINVEAIDNCSPADWLNYDYKIDLYNDGKGTYSGFDLEVGSLSKKSFGAGKIPYRHDNPYAQNPNSPFDASGNYPIGIHKICWYVEDGCGNIAANCKLFEVKDCKPPTPYCNTGLITTVMPSTGCITIWARDFDYGSYDNCTNAKDLKIYFDNNGADSLTICCEDFVKNKVNVDLTIPLTICVEDEEGNKDCCKTAMMVQDPHNVCPDVGHNAQISGGVKTMMDVGTINVDMQLKEFGTMKKEILTNNNGQYLFGDLAFGASKEYVIHPSRNDNPLNGVSTADIVKIQRHILGQDILASPYQWIAADVNRSSSITAADVSEIRKLVLGVITHFEKSESWTFVPKDHPMDLKYPWNSPREGTIQVPIDKDYYMDFVAIKVGDVNNSAISNNVTNTTSRNQGILQFEIDSHYIIAGELYKLEFKSRNFENISGYQFTLKFDQDVLNYEGFESGALTMSDFNFGTQKQEEGILTTSWNTKKAQSVEANTVLFSLLFRATKNSNLEDLLAINSQITRAEAYDDLLNSKDISLAVIHEHKSNEGSLFELYQNTPNPFDKETMIHFVLPESIPAQLSIYDLTGKVLWTQDINGKKGLNSVKLKRDILIISGVYYYQLNAGDYTSTKRMVVD